MLDIETLTLMRRRVLGVIASRGAVGKRELRRGSGLSWAGVCKVVDFWRDAGLVEEGESAPYSGKGRPATTLRLARKRRLLGFAPSVAGVAYAVCDLNGKCREFGFDKRELGYDPVVAILRLLGADLKAVIGRLAGIGLSFPGIIDHRRSIVECSTRFPDCVGRDLTGEIRRCVPGNPPVLIERNAVCDLHWALRGDDRGGRDVCLVSLRAGVSAAMRIDGHILRGRGGNVGELGHVMVEGLAGRCSCGNVGCLGTVVGGGAWSLAWSKLAAATRCPRFGEALAAGDPDAGKLLAGSVEYLIGPLRQIVGLLSPEWIILSSALPPAAADLLGNSVAAGLKDTGMRGTLVETLADGAMATARGAALLPMLAMTRDD